MHVYNSVPEENLLSAYVIRATCIESGDTCYLQNRHGSPYFKTERGAKSCIKSQPKYVEEGFIFKIIDITIALRD